MAPVVEPPMVPMPEGYYKGRVRILILFFEELAKTGKILQFSNFYERYVTSNGVTIPMKELQSFMNGLPTKKTEEEKQEIADQLFNRNDPSVKQLLDSFLEKNKNPISVTKLDANGNVVQVYNRKDSIPFMNGVPLQLNGNASDIDKENDKESLKNDQESELNGSSSSLEWLKQNDKLINVSDKEEEVLTKEPVHEERVSDISDSFAKFMQNDKNRYDVEISEENHQANDQESEVDRQQDHQEESRRFSRDYEFVEAESSENRKEEHSENVIENESTIKELSEKDKETAEIMAAQMRLYHGMFSGNTIAEDWNFDSKKEGDPTGHEQVNAETHNNDYQSLFQSFNDIISGMDERHQKENQEEEEREREKQRQQEQLEEERLRQIEEQRQLYEQQQREIEERIRLIEEQKLKDEENRKEHERMQQEMVHEQQSSHINQDSIEVVVKVEESNQTAADNVHPLATTSEQTDSANIQNGDAIDEPTVIAHEIDNRETQNRKTPKTLEVQQTNSPAERSASSAELSASINSLVVLYIKFISALHKILKAGPEKIEKYEEFKQIHDFYQTLVDSLIYIDENVEPDSEEYNQNILEAIREFYTGQHFLTILKQLKSDDSEFCKVLDYLLTKTNAKSQQISDEFNNVEAKNLAAITKERLESVQQLGKDDQTKVKELLRNNSQKLQPNYEKLITTLNVVIKHFSKYDYLAASSMHLEKYEKLQVKQPGKLCLFRDKMILIIEKKPNSETVFSSALKNVKVQQVVKNPSAPKKFFGRLFSCRDESLVTDDDVEKNASKNLLQVTQRTEKYRNTFRVEIISGERGGRAPDAKEFANMFDKLARLPDFQSVLAELEDFEKQT